VVGTIDVGVGTEHQATIGMAQPLLANLDGDTPPVGALDAKPAPLAAEVGLGKDGDPVVPFRFFRAIRLTLVGAPEAERRAKCQWNAVVACL
jgi:hypothetical protein